MRGAWLTESGVKEDIEEVENARIRGGKVGHDVGDEHIDPMHKHLSHDLLRDIKQPTTPTETLVRIPRIRP